MNSSVRSVILQLLFLPLFIAGDPSTFTDAEETHNKLNRDKDYHGGSRGKMKHSAGAILWENEDEDDDEYEGQDYDEDTQVIADAVKKIAANQAFNPKMFDLPKADPHKHDKINNISNILKVDKVTAMSQIKEGGLQKQGNFGSIAGLPPAAGRIPARRHGEKISS